jgi:hypothetical protein
MGMHACPVEGHRVAVLIDTPAPEQIFKDIEVMVQQVSPVDDDCYTALAGIVSDHGDLELRRPFAGTPPSLLMITSQAPLDVVPASVLPGLRLAISRRSTGILTFGCSVLVEHRAIDLIAAMLPLTDSGGPAARIKPRNRGTPAKDMMVPDAVKALPFLPSVESAYAHGYRRMIVEPGYTDVETMLKYADEVLFLMGSYGLDATTAFLDTARSGPFDKLDKVFDNLVAAVGVGIIEAKGEVFRIGDLFVPDDDVAAPSNEFEDLTTLVAEGRSVRWEDELEALLQSKRVSQAAVKTAFKRQRGMDDFFAARSKRVA